MSFSNFKVDILLRHKLLFAMYYRHVVVLYRLGFDAMRLPVTITNRLFLKLSTLVLAAAAHSSTVPVALSKTESSTGSVSENTVERAFQQVVSASSQPPALEQKSPVSIALIYPNADISDFWDRNFVAMKSRLDELNIAYNITEFSSTQLEHSLQDRHTDEVLKRADEFDFVILGPTELQVQASNIQRLSAEHQFSTFIWAFHTPDAEWSHKPAAWFDFSSSQGAQAMCDFLLQELGPDLYFGMNRGIPGVTDQQRSQEFKDCVESEGHWINLYEHFGQYQKAGGADGAALILKNFPEIYVLHNANTAMTMGAIEEADRRDAHHNLYITGWGGTRREIQKIREGKLDATPMRMSDDVGVATAEAVRYYLQGRQDEVPEIYLGRITVVNNHMTGDEVDRLMKEAFRYSGLKELQR